MAVHAPLRGLCVWPSVHSEIVTHWHIYSMRRLATTQQIKLYGDAERPRLVQTPRVRSVPRDVDCRALVVYARLT